VNDFLIFFSCCFSLPSNTSKSAQQTSEANEYGVVIAESDATEGATRLRQIFEDENKELLASFISHMEEKQASETVNFLKDYFNIKTIEEVELEEYCHKLVINFLTETEDDTGTPINLPSDITTQLKSNYPNYKDLLDVIKSAAEAAFKDLKSNTDYKSFIATYAKSLDTDLVNDYIKYYLKYEDRKTFNSLLENTGYGRLIRFILMVQDFEKAGPDKNQIGSIIFNNFIERGSQYEISRNYIDKDYLKSEPKKRDHSNLLNIRTKIIPSLFDFKDKNIVTKARQWKAKGSPKLQNLPPKHHSCLPKKYFCIG